MKFVCVISRQRGIQCKQLALQVVYQSIHLPHPHPSQSASFCNINNVIKSARKRCIDGRQRISIKLNRCDQLYTQHTRGTSFHKLQTAGEIYSYGVDALRERACFIFLIKFYCSLALEQSTNKIMIQQPWFVHTPIVCKKAPGSLIIFIANRLSRASLFIMIANYLSAHTFLKRPKLPIKLLVLQARLEKNVCVKIGYIGAQKDLGLVRQRFHDRKCVISRLHLL